MFYSLQSYIEWYNESVRVLSIADAQDDILSEPNYNIPMKRLLSILTEVYSPYRFVSYEQYDRICRAMRSYDKHQITSGSISELRDLFDNTEGLMELYGGLIDSGQLCEPLTSKELAFRLGVTQEFLLQHLRRYKGELPIQYGWKTSLNGEWRFDPLQLDNIKRWMMNRETGVKVYTKNEVGIDVTSLVKIKAANREDVDNR